MTGAEGFFLGILTGVVGLYGWLLWQQHREDVFHKKLRDQILLRLQKEEELIIFRLNEAESPYDRSIEDRCLHCAGSGECTSCAYDQCFVCNGKGLPPRDPNLKLRLQILWSNDLPESPEDRKA
jgi:hypothetical protein